MQLIKKLLLIVGVIILLIITVSFWYYKISLPLNARDLPWNIEVGSWMYNERIQSEYKTGMDALELTTELQEKGYKVLVVAKQEKEEWEPYCAITWWTVTLSEDNKYRVTSDMDSHSQICSRTANMHQKYREWTSLNQLIRELKENEFYVSMSANIKRSNLACLITWKIDWNENSFSRVENIIGSFRYNCL